MALDPDDYHLSMAVSPRAKGRGGNPDSLRTLVVNRLTDTIKAVMRRPRRHPGKLNLYCEWCSRWRDNCQPEEFVRCLTCNRLYRLEFAVYEEVEPDAQRDPARATGMP